MGGVLTHALGCFSLASGGGSTGVGPIPAFRSVGTIDGRNSLGSVCVPGLPAGTAANDILLLVCETDAGDVVPAPAGYAAVTGSPQNGADTALHVFWKRAGASEAAPTPTRVGDHTVARVAAFSGCVTAGNPINAQAFSNNAAGTSHTIPGLTTTINNCLVVDVASVGRDSAFTTHFSAWANADLASPSITEFMDGGDSAGGAGGMGGASGGKAVAGAVGTTTFTGATSVASAVGKLALLGP